MAGPWVVARMYDVSGSYSSAFVLCVFISIFAAAILLPLKPVYWLEMRARNKQDSEPPNAQVDKA
jgi:cyanate permease